MNRLDIIIDVLEIAANEVESAYVASHIDEALAAARELKALKPVAWIGDKPFSITRYETVAVKAGFSTPLYALDEVTK
jgi:hypothetical protein